MVDTDNNSLGSCTIPEKRQEYNCAHAVIGIDSAVEFFDCMDLDFPRVHCVY